MKSINRIVDANELAVIYDESIFALEPSTVRVREVGVTRNERRAARRERERERQATVAAVPVTPVESTEPADVLDHETRTRSDSFSSAIVPPTAQTASVVGTGSDETGAQAEAQNAKAIQPPYTTFQQLSFIPPVPASVLASAYVIPPTYNSVVGGDESEPFPASSSNGRISLDVIDSPPPLLSPISLLADHPTRHTGPPGLFFVSRGKATTGIVDGDGRSVLKKPFIWANEIELSDSTPDPLRSLHVWQRIEMLILQGGRKTVLVGIGATEIQAIEVGGTTMTAGPAYTSSIEVISDKVAKRKSKTAEGWT